MVDMIDNPEWMHRAMRFFSDGHLHLLDNLQAQGLLSLNNGNQYVGSGHWGWTDELPVEGYRPGQVRTQDMWGFTEGAGDHGGLARHALGFRDAVRGAHPRALWPDLLWLLRAPGPESSTISSGCRTCAPSRLAPGATYASPPRRCKTTTSTPGSRTRRTWPRCSSTATMCAAYIRETLDVARGCVVEMSLKDTHTCNQQPWRFDEWTRVAQEETQRRRTSCCLTRSCPCPSAKSGVPSVAGAAVRGGQVKRQTAKSAL